MERDPWDWAIADVLHFFQRRASQYLSDKPNGTLPPQAEFLQALEDNEVDGSTLLQDIGMTELRDDLGIKSLRARSSVKHCITRLQRESPAYLRLQNEPSGIRTPTSCHAPMSPPAIKTPIFSTPLANVGENIRPGEQRIEDANGRKRRKLNTVTTSPLSRKTRLMPIETDKGRSGWFVDSARPVDELFYEQYGFGQEINDFAPSKEIFPLRIPGLEDDEESFMFHSLASKTAGEVQYVNARMKYFLGNVNVTVDDLSITDVRRRNRAAIAFTPYSDRLQAYAKQQPPRRSATVFQLNCKGEAIAVREDALFLQIDTSDLPPSTAEDSGEWDFLVHKWGQKAASELFGPLSPGDKLSYTEGSSFDRECEDAEGASNVSEDDDVFTNDRVGDFVDMVINEYASDWSKKIFRLEETRAWSVWKKMKGSREMQRYLIASADTQIADLNRRITKYKKDVIPYQWKSESALREHCRVFEVTVQDREEQKWMLSVWQRKKEPEHVSRIGPHGTKGQHNSTSERHPGTAIEPSDRISVEPTQATSVEVVPESLDANEVFHTPDGSLHGSPQVESTNDDSDEMGISEEDSNTDNDNESDQESGRESDAGSVHSRTNPQSALPSPHTSPPRTSERYTHAPNGSSSGSECELPSMSELIPTSSKRGPDSFRSKSRSVTIDLTLSSEDSAQDTRSRQKRNAMASVKRETPATKSKAKPWTGNPDDANGSEIDETWEWSKLLKHQDRKRMLIKLLRVYTTSEVRADLSNWMIQTGQRKFLDQLRAALKSLQTGSTLEPEVLDRMALCASMFLTWNECDLAMMDKDPTSIRWDRVWSDASQLNHFCQMLRGYLQKQNSKLFVKLPPGPITISDKESEDVTPSPRKKRVREVGTNQFALTGRLRARDRLEKFNHIKTQSSHPEQLDAMIQNGPSSSEITINPLREESHSPIYVHSKIAEKMMAHQIEGVQFMWREIAASGEEGGQGCILAHTMGLGKTMQTIALLTAILGASQSSDKRILSQLPQRLRPKGIPDKRQLRVLIVCPPALIHNWRREIDQWGPRNLCQVFTIESQGKADDNIAELRAWNKNGGILLIGYPMLRSMIQRKSKLSGLPIEVAIDIDRIFLEDTELIAADEAHNLKNDGSGISKVMKQFQTQSRIALSGTPMSNHIREVYTIMEWVAPGYLGDKAEFNAHYFEPIRDGLYADSTSSEIRKSIKKLAVLRHEIEPKVHRADITVLKGRLPKKMEFMISVPLMEGQKEAYKRFVGALLGETKNDHASQVTMFGWLEALTLLGNHPLAFRRKLLDPKPKARTKAKKAGQGGAVEDDAASVDDEEDTPVLGLTDEKIKHILEPLAESPDPNLSAKTSLFIDVLRLSRETGDKVLVFSMKLKSLQYLSDLLTASNVPFGRIEGSKKVEDRDSILEDFQSPHSKLEVLLISTLAGGVGLNITGANRVVIFDFGFNPSHEVQAVGRAYRLGQTKPVYVYRFVSAGTFETDLHSQQLFKTGLAQRVVDKKNPKRNAERNVRNYLYEPKEVPQEELTEWMGKDELVLDRILGEDRSGNVEPRIRSIKTTETLEQDAMDAPLNEEERKEVNQEIEFTKARLKGMKGGTGLGMPGPSTQRAAGTSAIRPLGLQPGIGSPANTQPQPPRRRTNPNPWLTQQPAPMSAAPTPGPSTMPPNGLPTI